MAHVILRHRSLPSIYASEERFRRQPKNLPKFLAHDAQDFFIRQLQHLLIAAASEEAAQQRAVFRSTMRKFVVHESRGQHALAFAARHQKSEARR